MKRLIFILLFLLFLFNCASYNASIKPETIEFDILELNIADFEPGGDGFEQVTISIKNKSNKELEFSSQSFFEDSTGHYRMIYLPSKMLPNQTRQVKIRRTSYKTEGETSFNFTGNAWSGITGFEIDSGSGWRVSNSDLNVHDIYLTLIFKVDEKIYTNYYHLHN